MFRSDGSTFKRCRCRDQRPGPPAGPALRVPVQLRACQLVSGRRAASGAGRPPAEGPKPAMPGLLVLGVFSANAGREGFDQERVRGACQLLSAAAGRYQGARQRLR
jgi:hypothetical protein